MRVDRLCLGVAVAALLTVVVVPRQAAAASCESLKSLTLPETTITSAESVAAGAFTPPTPARGRANAAEAFAGLPAFCRVTAAVKRPGDTDVKIEIWMPAQGWNGDFEPAASGFAGGRIGYGNREGGMIEFLKRGAATGATNRGHDGGGSPRWKSSDISSTAYHVMVDRGKKIVAAFYGAGPKFTLMNECGGAGSRDALQLVQDWPADLDLATAIGFTNWGTHHGIAQMWVYQATHKTPESFIPKSKYQIVHQAALDACDAKDGVKDGVIEDPPHCAFDPGVLLCKGADGPTCLTAPQVEAVKTIYATPVHARTGAYLYGSMPPGGEMGWEEMIGDKPYPFAVPFYRDQVFKDPKWDYHTHPVNFDTDVDVADAPENLPINATNPDISKFIDRGGKLLLMGGWNDHTLGPGNNVHYYESVVAKLGERKVRNSVRLFMVPGMDHCLGDAYGPTAEYPTDYKVDFDPIAAMKQWKATGKAPDQIVVTTTGKDVRKRLVCAYPKVSQYKGTGSTSDPANFSCRMP
ncbi:MAG TPA: tannase/feruloyl esterase family alpha/beta hydrolase [Vicinamibacterales bacterium]|nr:tannase/feruloyl esterase family alpha/beta hydrolase [Vicinamibacterales bacterium]